MKQTSWDMSGFLCGETVATVICTNVRENFAAKSARQNFAAAKTQGRWLISSHTGHQNHSIILIFHLPSKCFDTSNVYHYILNRSRCGETSKQDAMERTHCAETHGLLEAHPSCFPLFLSTRIVRLYFLIFPWKRRSFSFHLWAFFYLLLQPEAKTNQERATKFAETNHQTTTFSLLLLILSFFLPFFTP